MWPNLILVKISSILKYKTLPHFFDKTLLKEGLRLTPFDRLKKSISLYERFEALTPFLFHPVVKTFSSFKEYEKWKKKQKDPRYW